MRIVEGKEHLELQARTIVHALKGSWHQGRGMCCCPAHDDRTPSLSVTIGQRAVLFHCFAGCSTRDVMAALCRTGIQTLALSDSTSAQPTTRRSRTGYSQLAQRLWHSAGATSNSPAERYLALRGIKLGSDQLRFLAQTPIGSGGVRRLRPAMIAAVTTDHGLIAAQRTFLRPNGDGLAMFSQPKRTLGSLGIGAVRLAPADQGRLGLAEGIESALSAMQLFGIPCWATLGCERFGIVSIPDCVKELYLFIDNDRGGAVAEALARKTYAAPGRAIYSRPPIKAGSDWNDELRAHFEMDQAETARS